jgi:PPOX class probable F420-dependent enzyme
VSHPRISQFEKMQYMSIESVRRNGETVSTPVWFVEFNGALYFQTNQDSGKVKRIRNHPEVRVAPCNMRGSLRGSWKDGKALFLSREEAVAAVEAYNHKYRFFRKLIQLIGGLDLASTITLKIELNESSAAGRQFPQIGLR